GAWIGAALGGKQASLLQPTKRGAIQLAVAGGMIWLGVQAGTAVLLRPWVPSEPLRVEWRRSAAGHAGFAGRVTSAFVSGSAVPDGSTPSDSELATRLGEGRVHLELGLTSGGITSGWSTVFQLVGSHGPLLAVEAVGTDLAFQPPARAYRLRLRSPTLRLPAALPSRPGMPLQFAAGEQHDTLWATSRIAGVRRQARQTLSPSLGWSLLIPFSYAYGPEVHLLTGLWLAGLLAPIAYWSAHTRGNGYRLTLALALLLLAGLGLIPLVAGYPAVHWSEWLAGGAGLAVGWGAHGAAAYLGDRCDSPSTRESC
ncbi:MAG TPA: hypothetical protein VGJ36_06160, partial [Gemmatimonadales bacterium]